MKLSGLVPNFHIHISVRDLYISTVGPPILLQQYRQTDCGNKKIAHRYMIVGIGNEAGPCSFISGHICFAFSMQCLCSTTPLPSASMRCCHMLTILVTFLKTRFYLWSLYSSFPLTPKMRTYQINPNG